MSTKKAAPQGTPCNYKADQNSGCLLDGASSGVLKALPPSDGFHIFVTSTGHTIDCWTLRPYECDPDAVRILPLQLAVKIFLGVADFCSRLSSRHLQIENFY